MGGLQRFEKRLGGLVEGAFAKVFRKEYVQPVEVASALQRECDDRRAILGPDRTLVPNDFVVELGTVDHERLAPYEKPLTDELAAMVREHAEEQAYQFVGAVSVRFELVDDLETGMFRVLSKAVASGPVPEPGRRTAGPAEVSAALEVGTSTLALTRRHTVLGRGAESDLRLDDPGISRRHAEIVLSDPPRISDLQSTNGTFVDGERVTSAELYNGARIGIGTLTLLFRYGG